VYVWSRNLKNEDAIALVGLQGHRNKDDVIFLAYFFRNATGRETKTGCTE
jgi:hypothetical protein